MTATPAAMALTIGIQHYLILAAALFCLGLLGLLTRRNAVNVLMSIELMLNSANINLVAFSRYGSGSQPLAGQLFGIFVIVVAAAEVAVALAIVLTLYRLRRSPDLDSANSLRG
jgi:NAD(P)H-quinone oxidoreductase subunit 4L